MNEHLYLRKMVERKGFLAKPKHQTAYPNEKNMFIAPDLKKSGDYHKNPSFSHLMDELLFLRKSWK